MSEEEKEARASEREAEKAAEAAQEQARVDAEAKRADQQVPYSRGSNEQLGGESYGYGSPAPGAGPSSSADRGPEPSAP